MNRTRFVGESRPSRRIGGGIIAAIVRATFGTKWLTPMNANARASAMRNTHCAIDHGFASRNVIPYVAPRVGVNGAALADR